MYEWLIINLDALAPLIPIFYIVKYKKEGLLKELFSLFLYLLSLFYFNEVADILSYWPTPNYWVYHINLLYTFFALLFFLKYLGKRIFYNIIFFHSGIGLIFLFIINTILFEKIATFNSISYSIASIYILIICLKYFWLKVKSNNSNDILKEPEFWFISALFIYYCSSVIVFFSYKFFIKTNDQMAGITWKFQSVMLVIMCILLTKGIKLKRACLVQ